MTVQLQTLRMFICSSSDQADQQYRLVPGAQRRSYTDIGKYPPRILRPEPQPVIIPPPVTLLISLILALIHQVHDQNHQNPLRISPFPKIKHKMSSSPN